MSEEFANVWREISGQIGAELIQSEYISHGDPQVYWCQLRTRVDKWPITVESYETTITYRGETSSTYITRLRAPYTRKDAFDFNINEKAFPIKLLKFFRLIRSPYIALDSHLMVVGTNESKLRTLFSNPKVYDFFQSVARNYEWLLLGVGPYEDLPTGVWALYCRSRQLGSVSGYTGDTNIGYLKFLFEGFAETLNQLVVIGAASEEPPNVVLSHVGPMH